MDLSFLILKSHPRSFIEKTLFVTAYVAQSDLVTGTVTFLILLKTKVLQDGFKIRKDKHQVIVL